MDNFLNEFGDRARRKRQELGLTLEEVAKKWAIIPELPF